VEKNGWRQALSRTRRSAFGRLASLLGASELTPAFWEQLEETLLQADLGVGTVIPLIEELQQISRRDGLNKGDQLHPILREQLEEHLRVEAVVEPTIKPFVIVLLGVNGSGKTTTAARLAQLWLSEGKSVLLAAADTYRAAAAEQLSIWGERIGVDVIAGIPGSDPGAVVYTAGQAALARDSDILIVDTSGRMHTQHNLMAELRKIVRVAAKIIPDAPHQMLLVLDATTGQNGLAQAKAFADAVDITGTVLAKLDSSARGGVGFAIASTLDLPILYAGTGEGIDDLSPFDPQAFINGILNMTSVDGQDGNHDREERPAM
jgi:fused signal recognition particle receptor